jgi:mannose-6-phosphate isomerase
MQKNIPSLLRFTPAIRNYVWGGHALLPLAGSGAGKNDEPIAEVWVLHEDNRVEGGVFAGRTLAGLTAEYPDEMLGTHGRGHEHFPLLIKLLDCERWLSLQVHPNDEQARQLEGAQFVGKTEAWYILNAQPKAQLIAGIKPNTSAEAVHAAIGNETILDLVEYHHVQTGDTAFMPAGTIHALGPGLLVYEVQQTSDLTYRVFDWNRPLTSGRALHVEKSIAVTDIQSRGKITRLRQNSESGTTSLAQCRYFHLELLSAPQERDTHGESFHALTVIDGEARIFTRDGETALRKFDSVLIPAAGGSYRLEGEFKILCSLAGRVK